MQKTCGRLSRALRLHTQPSLTVRVITMPASTRPISRRPTEEDSSLRARTRRQATLSTAEDRKTFGHRRGSAWCCLFVQAEQPRRDATVQFDSFGASSGALTYAVAVKLRALPHATL